MIYSRLFLRLQEEIILHSHELHFDGQMNPISIFHQSMFLSILLLWEINDTKLFLYFQTKIVTNETYSMQIIMIGSSPCGRKFDLSTATWTALS